MRTRFTELLGTEMPIVRPRWPARAGLIWLSLSRRPALSRIYDVPTLAE